MIVVGRAGVRAVRFAHVKKAAAEIAGRIDIAQPATLEMWTYLEPLTREATDRSSLFSFELNAARPSYPCCLLS